jgi:meprin A
MQFIRKALRGIESVSCIKFVQKTYERDFVLVYSGPGCESRLGKIGGQQTISLNRQGCLKAEYMVQHEFMHALGFNHMQNHADRDQYIIVVKNNIDSRQLHNFEKVNHQYFSNYDTPYDYLSIMHYASNFFALDPSRPTIITKDPRYQSIIGKTQKLSEGDITRLNRMYPCS